MPAQQGYFDTLKSVAGKIFSYLASITLTGTDGKTITVTQDTSLDEAVAMSSKAPKASPSFTAGIGIGGVAAGTGGVAFPATAVAVADANTLDDYEEGTFNFGVSFGGGTTGIAFSIQAGFYTKSGNMVHFNGYIVLTSKGSSTGAALITGLPFTSRNVAFQHGGVTIGFIEGITFANIISGDILATASAIRLGETTEAGVYTALTNADFADGSQIIIQGSYRTA